MIRLQKENEDFLKEGDIYQVSVILYTMFLKPRKQNLVEEIKNFRKKKLAQKFTSGNLEQIVSFCDVLTYLNCKKFKILSM